MNYSNNSSSTLIYVRTGTLMLCMTVGIFTNILFIVTITKSRALYRRSLFGLCVNLDCIFLLDIFLNQSFTLIASFTESWIFNNSICIAQSFSVHVVDTCLSLTLFLFGIDRLVAVRAYLSHDAVHSKGLTTDSVSLAILCLWLLSVCFSIPLVTNTIPSVFDKDYLACLPKLHNNLIYVLSNFVLTIGVPIASVSVMYVHIAVECHRERKHRLAAVLGQTEAEISHTVYTFVVHCFWLTMVGPYIVWIYIPDLTPDVAVIVSWMRHFFSWIPFICMVLYHKSFRHTFATVFVGHKYRSAASTNVGVIPPNIVSPNACNSHDACFNMVSNNQRLSQSRRNSSLYTDNGDGTSSATLSHASSMISGRGMDHLPKFPILFADGSGVHVVHNNLSNCHSFSSSTRDGAMLCDVRQNSFTDTSDAVSVTTQEGSFKQNNKMQRRSCDVKLPADVTDMYNHNNTKIKRIKRRPQLRPKTIRNTLESAFETPVDSNAHQIPPVQPDLITAVPKWLRRNVQKDSLMPANEDPDIVKNIPSQHLNTGEMCYDNSSFVLDYIGSTNV